MSARPAPSPLRSAVETRSAPALRALSRRPRWTLPLVSALLLAAVVFAPAPVAAGCLAALLALLGWLSYLSWPVVDGRGKLLRLASLALLAVLGAQSLNG